jgi:ferric hydroxamate transport system substrate-binding protein
MCLRPHGSGITRRGCIGGLASVLLGAGASPALARGPARIVCLEWTSAEMLISLGMHPVAVADTRGYRDWVAGPELPAETIDLGSRGEPNLEMLTELQPDFIIGAYGYGVDEGDFARFAPTFNVPFYDGTSTPYQQAEDVTRELGPRLDRKADAEGLIERTAVTIAEAGRQLSGLADEPLAIVSMFDDRHVRVYGRGSLMQDVLDRLGLVNAWTGETNSWGFSSVGIEELVTIGEARLISLDPIPPHVRVRIKRSTLWADLPCVRAGKVTTIPPVWPFGGLAAAARFATLLAAA